jgi:hypothetical protein
MTAIQCFGGLYDGTVLNDEFPHPERAFLVRGRGKGSIYNIDGAPHPDGPVRLKVRYELARTISGRLVYVPLDYYAVKQEDDDAGTQAPTDTPDAEGLDA